MNQNTPTPNAKADYPKPEQECDLVMKGGVTSGIVYPSVVLELVNEGKYRFRNLGGTSAGAITAAVTAAAEYGREKGGFEKLEIVTNQLKQPGFLLNLFQPHPDLKPLMFILLKLLNKLPSDFKADDIKPNDAKPDNTKPDSAEPDLVTEHSSEQKTASATASAAKKTPNVNFLIQKFIDSVREFYPRAAAQGVRWGVMIGLTIALVLVAIVALVSFIDEQITGNSLNAGSFVILFLVLSSIFALIGQWLGVLISGVVNLFNDLFNKLPENMFGVCPGHDPEQDKEPNSEPTALTDWLSASIDHVAGLTEAERPLTFGDLQDKAYTPIPGKTEPNPKVNINLKMVTSNLSQNQPYTLPFSEDHLLLFHEDEFKQLFPGNVVKHLINHQGKRPRYTLPPNSKFHFLPDPKDLPIVVATRMSLSFPLLISAVPLYTICKSAADRRQDNQPVELDPNTDLQKNWFSDGGISSNFPIHFFDAWLPSRPTFGINLTTLSPDALKKPDQTLSAPVSYLEDMQIRRSAPAQAASTPQKDPSHEVYLPAPDDIQTSEWVNMTHSNGRGNLATFIWHIFLTAQNYRDTMQSFLPGYRERIVQIRLSDQEGGLNLAMSAETVNRVMEKGKKAGDLLNQFNFWHHKWVRFRVLLGVLEGKLKETYQVALKPDPCQPDRDKFNTKTLIQEAQNPDKGYPFPYPQDGKHWQKAEQCAERIRESIEKLWDGKDDGNQPLPSLEEKAPEPKPVLRTTPEL